MTREYAIAEGFVLEHIIDDDAITETQIGDLIDDVRHYEPPVSLHDLEAAVRRIAKQRNVKIIKPRQ